MAYATSSDEGLKAVLPKEVSTSGIDLTNDAAVDGSRILLYTTDRLSHDEEGEERSTSSATNVHVPSHISEPPRPQLTPRTLPTGSRVQTMSGRKLLTSRH
jgi:hypothetical protein